MSFSRAKLTSRIAQPHPSATNNVAPPPASPKAPSSPLPTAKTPVQTLYTNFHQALIRQNVRWLHISYTFYSLIILENSKKNLSLESISQFVEVINWRAQGKITEEEFSILYAEWMSLPYDSWASPKKRTVAPVSPPTGLITTLDEFRLLLLEKSITESTLDLFIGIIVHEVNSKILNSTINYKIQGTSGLSAHTEAPGVGSKMRGLLANTGGADLYSNKLEIVTKRWLLLSEELFFLLDISGYGYWKYEECFFFSANLCLNLELFKSLQELENDLSLISLNVLTFQFMKDIGVQLNFSGKKKLYSTAANSGSSGGGCANITITMLKRFLIAKNLNEADLVLLIQLLKNNIENLLKLIKVNKIFNFYNACQPLEFKENLLSTPKLFQESVLIASGYYNNLQPMSPSGMGSASAISSGQAGAQNSSAVLLENIMKNYGESAGSVYTDNYNQTLNNFFIKQNVSFPSVISYLLSDAEKEISIFFHCIEFDVENFQFVSDNADEEIPGKKNHPLFSTHAANLELNEIALRIYLNYNKWVNATDKAWAGGVGIAADLSLKKIIKNNERFSKIQQDPIYKLVLSCLLTYKKLQKIYIAAVQDIAIERMARRPSNFLYFNDHLSKDNILLLCVNLLPKDSEMLFEMDLLKPEEAKGEEALKASHASLYGSLSGPQSHLRFEELIDEDDEAEEEGHFFSGEDADFVGMSDFENQYLSSSAADYSHAHTYPPYSQDSEVEYLVQGQESGNEENKRMPNKKTTSTSKVTKGSKTTEVTLDLSQKSLASTAPPSNRISSHIQSDRRKNAEKVLPPAPASPSSVSVSTISTREKKTPNYFKPTENFLRSSYNATDKDKQLEEHIISNIHNLNEKELADQEERIIKELLSVNNPKTQQNLLKKLKDIKTVREVVSKYKKEHDVTKKDRKASDKPKVKAKPAPLNPPAIPVSAPANTPHLPTSPSSHSQTSHNSANLNKNNKRLLQKYYSNDSFQSDVENTETEPEPSDIPPPPPSPPSNFDSDDNQARDLPDHDDVSEVSSSVGPNSIDELLEQGQNPGHYAQMLREILRRMSKDDSHVRIKSLEQVLELGHNIVKQDLEEKKKILVAPSSPTGGSSYPGSNAFGNNGGSSKKNSTPPRDSSNRYNNTSLPPPPVVSSSSSHLASRVSNNSPKVIQRKLAVPGVMPSKQSKQYKAFGHPV